MKKLAAILFIVFAFSFPPQHARAGDIDGLYFENVGMRVVKKSVGFAYVSWQVKLKSLTGDSFSSVTVKYQFLDRDGYVLKYDIQTTSLGSYESQIVRGQMMMSVDVSERIKNTVVKVTAIR